MENVIVVGGGPAGMLSAIRLAQRGFSVRLFEKNEKLGKKLFITGKGRCNLTNDCTEEDFFSHVVTNPRFLYSAYASCSSQDIQTLFRNWGLDLKVERGRRVFPASDHSYDVIDVLKRQLKKYRVEVRLNTTVTGLECSDGRVTGVRVGKELYPADRIIVATGGLSYPSTGSTGDGYRFAQDLGLKVTETMPSLVGLVTEDRDIDALQGLSLKNVSLTLYDGKKKVSEDFGEMLFTHYGISGPLVLSASALCGPRLRKGPLKAVIDLKSAVPNEKLDADLRGRLKENANKLASHAIRSLLPSSLVPVILERAGIPSDRVSHDVTKEERRGLVETLKGMTLTITSLRSFEEAIITKGGISVKEIDPATMAAKRMAGLYFIGEVLDLDAMTGGYNLQIAWTTAMACAES